MTDQQNDGNFMKLRAQPSTLRAAKVAALFAAPHQGQALEREQFQQKPTTETDQ